MNVKQLIELLETCEPTSEISIYVPDPEDDGFEFIYEIKRVDRHWYHQECTGKPNAIGIVATERFATYYVCQMTISNRQKTTR